MFAEMKRTALLLYEGKSSNDIVQLSLDENIYQLDTDKRRRDVPLRMIKRLSNLDCSLLGVIANNQDRDAKLIAFLALLKADRLLYEFMVEVYADKHNSGRDEISDRDFVEFIECKSQSSETVAKWSENNLKSIRSKIKSTLCDAGLAKRNGDKILIQIPVIDDELRSLLSEVDSCYKRAMLMEV
jgi:hypothetical protein